MNLSDDIFSMSGLESSQPKKTPPPKLQFFGPSSNSVLSSSKQTIHVIDAQSGQKTPIFAVEQSKMSKPNISLARILPNGDQQSLASASFSSLKPGTTVTLRNQAEFKMKTDLNSLTGSKKFSTPNWGTLEWKTSEDGMGYELVDQRGLKLAQYETMTDSLEGDPRLDIFVQGDEMFVEMVVISGIAVMKKEEKQVKQVMKVLGHVG